MAGEFNSWEGNIPLIGYIGILTLLFMYVCFFCTFLGVVSFCGFYTFPFFFPFGVISSRVSSRIVLVHVCLSIPCAYSISLVGRVE